MLRAIGADTAAGLSTAETLTTAVLWIIVTAVGALVVRRRVRVIGARATARVALWGRRRPGNGLVRLLKRLRRVTRGQNLATLRTASVIGLAAALGWSVAAGAGLSGPVMAAISATLSVQLSVHSSLKEGIERLGATLAGIAVAVAMWQLIGIHLWSVAVIAGASLVIGRLMRLAEAAVAVPATSLGILVLGDGITHRVIIERITATAVGVVIGAALSPFAGGVSPHERAQARLGALSTAIAELLTRLATAARDGYTAEEASQLLLASRKLDDDLATARAAVDELSGAARWSLTTAASQVAPLQSTLRVLAHSVDQVNSIARSLFDAVAVPDAPEVPAEIAPVLVAAADAFAVHAEVVVDAADVAELAGPIAELREVHRESGQALRRSIDDTGVMLLTGSMLTDLDRMAETLDQTAPALDVDVDPLPLGIPAVSEVLPVVRDVIGVDELKARLRGRRDA
jgi:uncharacterized membrane protein YgaE (UPF0421/DUF939 family)